jgi:hypothetical protein
MLFCFSFLLFFWPCIIRLYSNIFLFLYITKASPRLTLYHLKGKKGVRRLESPYRLKNYGQRHLPVHQPRSATAH